MNFQFANTWALLLLWLVPAAAVWLYKLNKQRLANLQSFVGPEMQKKLFPADIASRFTWQASLLCAGLAFAILAAARPQWGFREEMVNQRGRDLLIVLDVSRSMLANDVRPSRLQRAKADIADLIKELRGDRAGLVAFRYKAVMLCPLTTDYGFLRHVLESVSIDSAPQGETDIGDAINKAVELLENDEGSHKAIVLISDGEDLSGRAEKAAEAAAKKEIPIFAVGLGSTAGSTIPDPDKKKSLLPTAGTAWSPN